MSDHEQPPPDAPSWDNPDYCPFCGEPLPDGGPGFVEHAEEPANATCNARFEEWRRTVVDDVAGDWSG